MLLATEEYIAQLIFLHLQGISDEGQEQELAEWRAASTRHEEIYMRLSKQEYWENSFQRFIKSEEEHLQGWNDLNERIRKSRRMLWIKRWSYAAAILLLLGVGGSIFYHVGSKLSIGQQEMEISANFPKPEAHAILTLGDGTEIDLKDEEARQSLSKRQQAPVVGEEGLTYQTGNDSLEVCEYHKLTVPRGGEYVLVLADGSRVFVNAGSTLTFPIHFSGKERRVYLEGEAYFNIEKNPDRPFIVEVKPLEVEVTGTTFGVRAYQDEPEVLTTLETGKVRVRNGEVGVNLTPSKQAVFDKSTAALKVEEVDISLFLGWKEGRIIFDDCPLERILTELGRWYDLDIFYAREELRSYRFSLNIKKHEAFSEVLKLLEDADQIRFEVNGNTIVVR